LDCGLLAKPGGFLAPSAVLALAHDVAAAMVHLHIEGIVHGDLKAGNVMLTSSSSGSVAGLPAVRMWASGTGDRTLTAKVADFGLALPLGPRDTHATLLARVGGCCGCRRLMQACSCQLQLSACCVPYFVSKCLCSSAE
jgi:serine/threonine protein kinase